MLRTLPTPSSVIADTVKLWWAWRKNTERAFLRSFILIALAFVFVVSTVAASVFSSLIISTGTIEVLVDSPFCGGISNRGIANRTANSFTGPIFSLAPSWAETCYKNGSLPKACNFWMQPNIPLTVQDSPCPLPDPAWCNTTKAVSIDTGLLDVFKTFGLNLGAEERVQFRRKTTCSILPIAGAYDVVDLEDSPKLWPIDRQPLPKEQFLRLFYGDIGSAGMDGATFGYTLAASNFSGTMSAFT
jgi:hypothetical protein